MPVAVRVHEPVREVRVLELVLAQSEARAQPARQIRRVGHRLHPARHDDATLAGRDLRRGEHHRLEPGAADLVHRRARDRVGDARSERGLPRWRLPDAGLHHVAHEDLVNLVRPHTRALQGALDGDRAKLRSGDRSQSAKERADGRARRAEDDGPHFAPSSASRRATCSRYERISSRSAVSSPIRSFVVARCASSSSISRGRTLAFVRCRP